MPMRNMQTLDDELDSASNPDTHSDSHLAIAERSDTLLRVRLRGGRFAEGGIPLAFASKFLANFDLLLKEAASEEYRKATESHTTEQRFQSRDEF